MHVPGVTIPACGTGLGADVGAYRGWVREGYTGYGEGYTGYRGVLPSHQGPRPSGGDTSGAGPGSPKGAGVGGYPCSAHGPVRPSPETTHSGPPGSYGARFAVSGLSPSKPRLLANIARIDLISWKLSLNAEVSPKSVQKASHSPYIQNEVQKSPLQFLRFPFLLAFSHKELLTLF